MNAELLMQGTGCSFAAKLILVLGAKINSFTKVGSNDAVRRRLANCLVQRQHYFISHCLHLGAY